MKRMIAAALLAALPASALFASGDDAALTPERKIEITQKMTEMGYEVRKIDSEDGMIEVYAIKDGARFELYLDAALNIVTTKEDD